MSDGESDSIFFDEWADEKKRERSKLHAREIYNLYVREQEQAHRAHMAYARWLFGALIAVHGGVIYALNSLRLSIPSDKSGFLIGAAETSFLGIFLTLVAGLSAWGSLQEAEDFYGELARPELLYRADADKPVSKKWMSRFFHIALSCGIMSGLAFGLSSGLVIYGLEHL